ncbi:hypothetical protein HJFPF1_07083 [Paramyrothecium foliicola]|nr:hypothetical protein HJFPF1_07083 [Paramyrothecium foliicola]
MFARIPRIGRIWWWLLLANLPASILHIALGLINGAFDYAVTVQWLRDLSVPCEPTAKEAEIHGLISEVSRITVPPYDVPKLLHPIGWWKRLSLRPIDQSGRIGYRRPLHADSWYRKTGLQDPETDWHHWVYLSGQSPTSETWDAAFAKLMARNAVQPEANGAGFHHASCRQSGLCARWLVRGPALVHFTTNSLDEEQRQVEVGSEKYNKVTMCFIELGGNADYSKSLKRSPFDQLRNLTQNAEAWRQECHTRSEEQHLALLRQMNYGIMSKKFPRSYGRLRSLGAAILPKLWPRVLFAHGWIAMVTYEGSRLSIIAARSFWDVLSATLAASRDHVEFELSEQHQQEDQEEAAHHEVQALELASTFVQCAEEGPEFLQRSLTPDAWESINKLRGLLPEEYRRALDEGKVSCGLRWPAK